MKLEPEERPEQANTTGSSGPPSRMPQRWLTCPRLTRAGAPHAFFTRHAAADVASRTETGPSSSSVPVAGSVLAARLGADCSHLFQARQVHGTSVIDIAPDADPSRVCGCEADALIAATPGQAVAVRTADCVPILVYEPSCNVAAAIHAGWRGAAAGVVEATLERMIGRYGCQPAKMIAAVGPAIGACHFEVGEDLAARFAGYAGAVVRGAPGARPHVDLRRVVVAALADRGVEQVSDTTDCTFCRPQLYHSFRRDGAAAGRLLSVIGLRGPAPRDGV